ncbi:hypothetical protein DVA76_18435, partial [Acinetobacter baumannii]
QLFHLLFYFSELAVKHTVVRICVYHFTCHPPDHLQIWVLPSGGFEKPNPSPTKVDIKSVSFINEVHWMQKHFDWYTQGILYISL